MKTRRMSSENNDATASNQTRRPRLSRVSDIIGNRENTMNTDDHSTTSSTTTEYVVRTGGTPVIPVDHCHHLDVLGPSSKWTERHYITEGYTAQTFPCIASAATREIYHHHYCPILCGARPLLKHQTERVQLLPIHRVSCRQGWTRQGRDQHRIRRNNHQTFYSRKHQGQKFPPLQRRQQRGQPDIRCNAMHTWPPQKI